MEILSVSKCILVNSEGKILLLRRSPADERRPDQWDIPGGHVDRGEHTAEAAARETSEEAGITVDPKELSLVFAMTEVPREGMSVTWVFYRAVTAETVVQVSGEHSEYRWVSLTEAVTMITYDRQNRALSYVLENDLLTAAAI